MHLGELYVVPLGVLYSMRPYTNLLQTPPLLNDIVKVNQWREVVLE